jgi:Flp pilus assembly protein TadG
MRSSLLAAYRRTLQALRAFGAARNGNVAIMFAMSLIPVVGLVGAAVDYSRGNSAKVAMQSALDSATLLLSKEANGLTTEQLQQKAHDYFFALINRPELQNIVVNTPVLGTSGGSSLTITVTASVKSDFMGIVGVPEMNLQASSLVKWGNTRLRVALGLDNTGSMADNDKIGSLKTATHKLLNSLKNAATRPGDVYVSIVPFSRDVNAKYDNSVVTANWLRWDDGTDASWDGTNGSCSISGYSPRSACKARGICSLNGNNTSQGRCGTCSISGNNRQSDCVADHACSISGYNNQNSCTSHGVCSNSSYTTQSNCTSHSATWTWGVWQQGVWTPAAWAQATWTPNDHATWNGCVMDRDQSYDTNATTPSAGDTATPSTLFYPDQYSNCPAPLLPMTYDWNTLNTKVDAMFADGNTNQTIGLQWAWQSLSNAAPLNAPAIDTSDGIPTKQIIILLTDGLNTQNRWSNDRDEIDARMAATCTNAKAPGSDVVIYTVQVSTNGDPLQTVLQNCASPDDTEPKGPKFFMLTSGDQVVTTFNQIGTSLSKLRLAQ